MSSSPLDSQYISKSLIYTNLHERVTIYKATRADSSVRCVKEQRFSSPEDCAEAMHRHQLQQALSHPNVCCVFNVEQWEDEDGFNLGVELEWCGQDLDCVTKGLVKEKKTWTEEECWKVLASVVSALSYAQRNNVCHRDLKPSNIFRTDEGVFKVGDFGCAKTVEGSTLRHTMTGTPLFLSPVLRKAYMQQIMGEDVDTAVYNPFKSDVYSLGLTLLFLLKPSVLSSFGNYAELTRTIAGLEVTQRLKDLLGEMLTQDETSRIDLVTVDGKVNASEQSSIPKKRRLVLVRKANMEAPPSAVQLPSPTPPLTQDFRLCEHCGCSFQYCSSDPWRLDLLGSTMSQPAARLCSQRCFTENHHRSSQREVSEISRQDYGQAVGEWGEELQPESHDFHQPSLNLSILVSFDPVLTEQTERMLHCFRHTKMMTLQECTAAMEFPTLWPRCPQCFEGEIHQVESGHRKIRLCENSLYPGILFLKDVSSPIMYPVPASFLTTLQRGSCHLCAQSLQTDCFAVFIHGQSFEVICSYACLFAFPESQFCPVCSEAIPRYYYNDRSFRTMTYGLVIALVLDEGMCALCRVRPGDYMLPCDHNFCYQCLALMPHTTHEKFGCQECCRTYEKQDHRELFQVLGRT